MCKTKNNNRLNFLEYGNYIRRFINIPMQSHPFWDTGFIPVIMLKRCGTVYVKKIRNCLNFKWRNLIGQITLLIITREYAFIYSMKMKVLWNSVVFNIKG